MEENELLKLPVLKFKKNLLIIKLFGIFGKRVWLVPYKKGFFFYILYNVFFM